MFLGVHKNYALGIMHLTEEEEEDNFILLTPLTDDL